MIYKRSHRGRLNSRGLFCRWMVVKLYVDNNVSCSNIGKTSVLSSRHRANVDLTNFAVWINFKVQSTHHRFKFHYNDVIMGAMASQITNLMIVYWSVHSGADQRKHQRSTSLAFAWGIHRWPVNSQHKVPVKRNMFPFWWCHYVMRTNRMSDRKTMLSLYSNI